MEGLFDADGYRALSSDIVAHLVFTHQAGMTNLLTRAGWEARAADPSLHPLFAPDPGRRTASPSMMSGDRARGRGLPVVHRRSEADRSRSEAGRASRSGSRPAGRATEKGRSLHELDLNRRLMKYPCSYLIYSPAFDALPPLAKDPIYRRMWEVLSGQEQDPRYRSALSLADRQSIVEILRDTKKDLPPYFQNVTR